MFSVCPILSNLFAVYRKRRFQRSPEENSSKLRDMASTNDFLILPRTVCGTRVSTRRGHNTSAFCLPGASTMLIFSITDISTPRVCFSLIFRTILAYTCSPCASYDIRIIVPTSSVCSCPDAAHSTRFKLKLFCKYIKVM